MGFRLICFKKNKQQRIHVLSHPGVAYCFPKWRKLEKLKNVVRIPKHEKSENLQRECQQKKKVKPLSLAKGQTEN